MMGMRYSLFHHPAAAMAKLDTQEETSSYYPPRARWYSPVFYFGYVIRRHFWLDRIHIQLPQGITFAGSAASFLVPGLGIHIRGRKFWGLAALAGYGLLLLIFAAGFGYPIGNFAFGLMLAIHTSGFVYYCDPVLRREELGARLAFVLAALLAVGLLVYLPLRNFVLQHWLVPFRLNNGHVFVVQRQFPAAAILRGDWIAYKLGSDSSDWQNGWAHGAVHVRFGLGLGPVLAMAGDRVGFSTNGFTVNGLPHALLPHMPQTGEIILREKQWFVWPELGISGYGNTPEGNISGMMLQLAVVSENDFIGKPFKQWFGRRQITP